MEAAVVGAVVGTTIKVVLDNLLSFPVEETGLLWDFKDDLQKLKQSVGTIRDFLDDAEMKQVTDKPVQRWLHKLEALAFDADYVLDELNYRVLLKQVKTDKKMKKKVSSVFSTSNHIAFHYEMAKKIKHVNKELKLINKEASELGLQIRFSGAHAHGAATEALVYLETDSFSVDPVFVGRENDVTKIVDFVTSTATHEHVISVLPIVGMGGLGKTTLATKVYNDNIIISHFKERIWVHVSANFDPVIVLRRTLESLIEEKVDGTRDVVLRKTEKRLKGKRYLLVLDNVWNDNNDKWDNFVTSLTGISSVKGNVIIVTTRMGSVASIVKTHDIHELGGLSKEDCWSIIKAKAFGLGGEGIPSVFETIGKNIAKRCGGLPLAAKVVGSLLRGKSKDAWSSTEDKWLSDFGGDGDVVSKILKLSYDNLLPPLVKKCFAFCSIIPKGFRWIEKDEMIHLWMAEGLLQTDREKDMEIVGNEVFKLLEQSSLLQVCLRDNFGNVERFAMHDLVHDLALSVLNPNFLDNNYQVRYLSRPFIDELSPTTLEEHAKSLRALYLNGKVSHIKLSNFKCLHVLILDDEDIKELPIKIGNLISLRLLDISHTRVEYLPDSTGDLYHLQTLRATKEYGGKSFLRKLPDTFKSLISLRHLYIPNIELPPGIGKLVSLQTLPYFQVGEKEGCGIMELGRLTNLRGEIEIHNLEKVGDKEEAKSADLFHKPNIFKLKLVWNVSGEGERSNDENVLEGLQPHPNLKSLEIDGFKGRRFSLWTMRMEVREEVNSHRVRLDNLLEIKLSGCEECKEIPMLGQLPHLKWLYLHGLSNVKCMGSLFYGIEENWIYKETVNVFPALEKLELIGMKNLSAWDGVEFETQPRQVSVFGRLEYLKITDCRQLLRGPSDFPCLKELEIENMESGLPLANICGSKLTSLTKLVIESVDGLERLPDGLLYNNRDLKELKIRNCNNLTRLVPCFGGGGSSLRKLGIHGCLNLKELPEDLHSLNALQILMISSCQNLKSIAYNPQGCGGGGGRGFTSLRTLQVAFCDSVTNLPIQMIESCALSLESLLLRGSKSITNLPQVMSILAKMPRLHVLNIQQVPKFTEVVVEIDSLRSLVYLGIGGSSDCVDYVSFKMSLDRFIPTLQSLHMLNMYGMEHWDALPDQLQHLTTLHHLYLVDFGIEALPDWFVNFSYLRILGLYNCQKIRHLASKKAMQGLTKLTTLYIYKCPVLKQNLEAEAGCSTDDSEWSKISHIPTIIVDSQPFSAHAQ